MKACQKQQNPKCGWLKQSHLQFHLFGIEEQVRQNEDNKTCSQPRCLETSDDWHRGMLSTVQDDGSDKSISSWVWVSCLPNQCKGRFDTWWFNEIHSGVRKALNCSSEVGRDPQHFWKDKNNKIISTWASQTWAKQFSHQWLSHVRICCISARKWEQAETKQFQAYKM